MLAMYLKYFRCEHIFDSTQAPVDFHEIFIAKTENFYIFEIFMRIVRVPICLGTKMSHTGAEVCV